MIITNLKINFYWIHNHLLIMLKLQPSAMQNWIMVQHMLSKIVIMATMKMMKMIMCSQKQCGLLSQQCSRRWRCNSYSSRATRESSDLRTQTQWRRSDITWLSNDVSAIVSSSLFDANDNGMWESKIANMALRNNAIYDNVSNNNDMCVAPRLHKLAKYCNIMPSPPVPNTFYHGVVFPPKEFIFCF